MAVDAGAVLISAIMAGAVAILATLVIERWGGALGSIVAIPTTIVPAAIGIWHGSASVGAHADAMSMVPIGMMLNILFLGAWRVLPSRLEHRWSGGSLVTLVAVLSVAVWLVAAGASTVIVSNTLDSIAPFWIGSFATLLGFGIGLRALKNAPAAPAGHNAVHPFSVLMRGVAAASAIGLSVLIAGMGLPFISGVISVFPAIFLTTMVSLWLAQGSEVPVGATGPMMLGATSVSVYSLIAIGSFPVYGPWIGSALAWFGSVILYSLPIGFWTNHRIHPGAND
ncbi:MAG: Uncharacterised protein [Methanobacteriota archaeon]|nr:MAG: Uncharacterised protein [Euryarchaeota archaeon]